MDKQYCIDTLIQYRSIDPTTNCWNYDKTSRYDYGQVLIYKKNFKAHRLSAFIWLDFDLSSKLHVLHKCDNMKCFNPEHLFVGTNLDNIKDKVRKGRQYKAEDHHRHKLTPKEVLEIRDLYDNRAITQRQMAVAYGVSRTVICMVVHRAIWKSVKELT